MKRKYIFVTGFFVFIAVFAVTFGLSYHIAKKNHEKKQNNAVKETKQVDTIDTIRITDETEYVLETYYGSQDNVKSEILPVPAELAGKNRKELDDYIKEYLINPPLEESLAGLTDYEMISFSKERLVLRKTYQDLAKENRFYVVSKDDEVMVYYNDKKTVFLNTGIVLESLPEDEQGKLRIGYFIKDEEQLYSMLENYSS